MSGKTRRRWIFCRGFSREENNIKSCCRVYTEFGCDRSHSSHVYLPPLLPPPRTPGRGRAGIINQHRICIVYFSDPYCLPLLSHLLHSRYKLLIFIHYFLANNFRSRFYPGIRMKIFHRITRASPCRRGGDGARSPRSRIIGRWWEIIENSSEPEPDSINRRHVRSARLTWRTNKKSIPLEASLTNCIYIPPASPRSDHPWQTILIFQFPGEISIFPPENFFLFTSVFPGK